MYGYSPKKRPGKGYQETKYKQTPAIKLTHRRESCSRAGRKTVLRIDPMCPLYIISSRSTKLDQNLPSRYARNVKYPINRISATNNVHDRNDDQESIRCSTNMLENNNADCHA